MKLKSRFRLLFVFPIACFFLLLSCEKDPEIITEIVTVTDTIVITETLIDTVVVIDTVSVIETVHDTATTFILVRHAETMGSGSNPFLSGTGQARADELQRILSNVPLNAVYSTNFNRTMLTAQPTAADQGLNVTNYDAFSLDPFIDNVLDAHQEGVVLVVGHSNTTPSLLNKLVGANTYSDLPESEYDNLYVVYVFEKGRAKVVHMKYGG
jgi:broad specificity phosphatase PhoE